ncbi:hypothetical protein CDEF62S_01506 [Castellaniella defragrans]
MLPGIGLEQAEGIAQRLCAHIARAPILAQQPVTVSVGVAAWRDGKVEEVLKAADQALYRAKQEGRNRVVVADPRCGATVAQSLTANARSA